MNFTKNRKDANNEIIEYSSLISGIKSLNQQWFDDLKSLEPKEERGEYVLGAFRSTDKAKVKEQFANYVGGVKLSFDQYVTDPCPLEDSSKIRFEQKMYELFKLKPAETEE